MDLHLPRHQDVDRGQVDDDDLPKPPEELPPGRGTDPASRGLQRPTGLVAAVTGGVREGDAFSMFMDQSRRCMPSVRAVTGVGDPNVVRFRRELPPEQFVPPR